MTPRSDPPRPSGDAPPVALAPAPPRRHEAWPLLAGESLVLAALAGLLPPPVAPALTAAPAGAARVSPAEPAAARAAPAEPPAAAAAGRGAAGPADYDPLAEARGAAGRVGNKEASVPAACYAKTEGRHNTCWVCHTGPQGENRLADFERQAEYAFSDYGATNRWANLFEDRRAAAAAIGDAEALAYVREDNYGPLRRALAARAEPLAFRPDLELAAGFDALGFARDGSGWRALRYKPFPGAFWPTNGGAGDAFVRLPPAFRADAGGAPSLEVYRANLSILEANVASDPATPAARVDWPIEPLDERALGVDLDGDGALRPGTTRLRGLPARYLGAAGGVRVRKGLYPRGVEFLHSVRYLDPDRPALAAERMKELRYSRKEEELGDWAVGAAYEREAEEKDEGRPPSYRGSAVTGLRNAFGWLLQGYIEDREGRLRLQTDEEHRACMGCHGGLGVTTDATFALPRKVPGAEGWRPQDLRGMPDAPQVGQRDPEVLTYLRRAGGGDELRGNGELRARFFRGGRPDEAALRRAAPGGDRDLADLVAPSRERALALDKAYLALVRAGRFSLGRDAPLAPPDNLHASVEAGAPTGLAASGRLYADGRLQLAWARR
ncbi:MAG TPA: hypothetical protein VFS43_42430 [Polyangiaceae bacterium]|nr:hypothetical protein [Polyangiaceae bacterium]